MELRLPRAQRMQNSFYMVLFKWTYKHVEKGYFDPWAASETLGCMKWDTMKGAFACDLIYTELGQLTWTFVRGRSAFGSIPQTATIFKVSIITFLLPSICELLNNYVFSQFMPMVFLFIF